MIACGVALAAGHGEPRVQVHVGDDQVFAERRSRPTTITMSSSGIMMSLTFIDERAAGLQDDPFLLHADHLAGPQQVDLGPQLVQVRTADRAACSGAGARPGGRSVIVSHLEQQHGRIDEQREHPHQRAERQQTHSAFLSARTLGISSPTTIVTAESGMTRQAMAHHVGPTFGQIERCRGSSGADESSRLPRRSRPRSPRRA